MTSRMLIKACGCEIQKIKLRVHDENYMQWDKLI